ncbi:hypothetical protein C1X61_03840 [Pseudomonas sp. FW215-T2]|nr:hypothetical protein C1X61_03840 [Pseudomonas sp. FW215-T2]PNA16157.1 hypothetical protein C1X62_02430 [Pseudomonas sp. FW215-R3]PNB39901.1 hypothetical protein C1X63_00465 [Pseudomonas sp. FW305-131]
MEVNDNARYLKVRIVLKFFASKLAPTVKRARHELLIAIIFSAARNGVATRESVRRLKKGVRLWLSTMAKG